jgi:hypothetical protein
MTRTVLSLLALSVSAAAFALPQTMTLSVTAPLVPGEPVLVRVTGAPANAPLVLVQSDGVEAPGACPAPLAGDCLDITAGPSGYTLVPVPLTADPSGVAEFQGVLPAGVPAPQDWVLQAVHVGSATGNRVADVQVCPADDQDCDTVAAVDDCDDHDATVLGMADDADCDGIPTALDCTETGGDCPVGEGDCDPSDCGSGLICEPDVGSAWGYPADFDVCVPCPAAETLAFTSPGSGVEVLSASSSSGWHACDTGYIVEVTQLDANPWPFTPFADWSASWPLPASPLACSDAWATVAIERLAPRLATWVSVGEVRFEGQWSTQPFNAGCQLVPLTPLPTFTSADTAALRLTANAGGPTASPPGCTGFCPVLRERPVETGVTWLVPPS